MPTDHILTADLIDQGFRLSCNGVPLSPELRVVYNVKHLPGLAELRLPPYPFEQAHVDD
ncbi:ferredoxin [Halobacterium salinarum NRC-1]|nr:ferredoxin [Halobacterium salinarum NRC-1]